VRPEADAHATRQRTIWLGSLRARETVIDAARPGEAGKRPPSCERVVLLAEASFTRELIGEAT
jgi:hypothetical protein